MQENPIVTKGITSAILYGMGNVISQVLDKTSIFLFLLHDY